MFHAYLECPVGVYPKHKGDMVDGKEERKMDGTHIDPQYLDPKEKKRPGDIAPRRELWIK